jgi:hypothetical protein
MVFFDHKRKKMRLTDDRYANERSQFELALRMIRHEARTSTIRQCTGLSDDRIRKLYGTYFRNSGRTDVRRRRGKSPRQITRFVKNADHQLQSTTLVALYNTGLLLRIDDGKQVRPCWPRPDVEFGHRLCRAFETYLLLHERPLLSFEWAWTLLHSICGGEELYLAACSRCDGPYVQDAYALDLKTCPCCEIEAERRRRPGVKSFGGD